MAPIKQSVSLWLSRAGTKHPSKVNLSYPFPRPKPDCRVFFSSLDQRGATDFAGSWKLHWPLLVVVWSHTSISICDQVSQLFQTATKWERSHGLSSVAQVRNKCCFRMRLRPSGPTCVESPVDYCSAERYHRYTLSRKQGVLEGVPIYSEIQNKAFCRVSYMSNWKTNGVIGQAIKFVRIRLRCPTRPNMWT